MNQPWIYMCSPSRSPSRLPLHPIPLGLPSAPALSTRLMQPTWAGDLILSRSHLIVYLFQCYSLRTSHPRLLPQSPKVCSVHLCLFFFLHIGLSLPSSIIPYRCVSILYWCLSFWLTSLCIIGSSFIHLIRTDSNEFFLMAE